MDFVFDEYLNAEPIDNFSFESLITLLTQLHFENVDKRIEKIGEKWGNYVITTYPKLDELEFESFSCLLLNNVSFFHEKVFPNVDLQGIENSLQVAALLEGKYFRYLTNKKFHRDLNFRFE
jgi:hypothetical protein